ncbi:unnamed protein product, partial [Mesorhabditis belari]|uniref:RING-CH-type domain-containing protein n=1 Tax=Mesorhabditis belari TaxID=2138241 RepID=A0AAF3EJ92_9BILA
MLQNVFNQVTDSQLSTSPACRIRAQNEDVTTKLIRLCNCKGSIACVHNRCLLQWVTTTNKKLDFRCSTAWLIFMSTLFFLVVRNGLFDLRNLVGCVIGNSTIWYKLCD